MDLSKISTVVRPRSNWQAIDLGMQMARQWYMPLLTGYLVLTLPVFLVLQLSLKSVESYLPMLIFWWLKPLWERILLAYVSVRQFGEQPTVKQQLAMWRKVALRQLLPVLTWRRLSVQRSYIAAIYQLENLSGSKQQKRARQFAGENQQAAFWLTVVGSHIEAFITMALLVLVLLLLPQQMQSFDLFNTLIENDVFVDVSYYIAMVTFAPFYVCGGFALYLNQRTKVEGWDIEIIFRRMVERQQNRLKSKPLLSIVGALFLTSLLMAPQPTSAAQADEQEPMATQTEVRQAAQQIIKQPPFVNIEEKTYPEFYLNRPVHDDEKPKDKTKPDEDSLGDWLAPLMKFFAEGVEWLLYGILAVLLVYLAIRYRHVLLELLSGQPDDTAIEAPKVVFGLNIDKASLPKDPAKAAQDLWQQGQKRQALSLLYRGALMILVSKGQLHFHDSFTEGECLEQVKQKGAAPLADYFGEITHAWQQLAYAKIEPQEATMQSLFGQWHSVFVESLNAK